MRKALVFLVLSFLVVVAVAFWPADGSSTRTIRTPPAPEFPALSAYRVPAMSPLEVELILFVQDVEAWRHGEDVAEWEAGEERARVEAAQRAAQSASRASTRYHPGTTDDGECTGFSIPSYIIQRESGGNPSAYNPSGAYGCAQTLLSHYSSGACQGLDPYTIQGQRDCVEILSNGGTNLQPWAATR